MKINSINDISLSEEQISQFEEGVDWLKEWLMIRNLDGKLEGEEYTCEEYLNRLDNVTINVVKNKQDIYNYLIDEIQQGNLHFTEEYMEKNNGNLEEALENFDIATNSGQLYGLYNKYVSEPVVFITEYTIKNELISSVVTHECTHMLELKDNEKNTKSGILKKAPNQKYDPFYLDSREEVYARLMQFRKAFNLDPTKIYTEEDIAKLRQDYANSKKTPSPAKSQKFSSIEDLRASLKAAIPEGYRDRENLEENFLNRYTDEQIATFLNDTASNDIQQKSELLPDSSLNATMHMDLALTEAKFRAFERNQPTSTPKETPTEEKAQSKQTTLSPEMIANHHNNQYT